MSKTKDKILNSARSLFNQRGVSDVTLRDIAEKVGISIGNLAYHYKNKDFMIAELFDKMEEEKNYKDFPLTITCYKRVGQTMGNLLEEIRKKYDIPKKIPNTFQNFTITPFKDLVYSSPTLFITP